MTPSGRPASIIDFGITQEIPKMVAMMMNGREATIVYMTPTEARLTAADLIELADLAEALS